jgi:hypothetical protein
VPHYYDNPGVHVANAHGSVNRPTTDLGESDSESSSSVKKPRRCPNSRRSKRGLLANLEEESGAPVIGVQKLDHIRRAHRRRHF